MNTISKVRSLLAGVVLTTLPCLALAQEAVEPPMLYSGGSAPYRVEADAVEFLILVEAKGGSAHLATSPCANVVDSVRKALDRLALRTMAVEVIPQGVTPIVPQYGQPATSERFIARTLLRVRLTDPRDLTRVTVAALDAGAARTAGFRYSSRQADAARAVAFDSATARANASAQRVARSLGGRLGSIRQVNFGDANPSDVYQNYPIDQDQSARNLPEVRGTITVSLTWNYLPDPR